MLKNTLYIAGSIVIFFAGLILYGVILNIRERPLKEVMAEKGISKLGEISLIVDRKNFHIELYSDKALVKTYKAAFGKNNSTVKTTANDFVTPIGEYKICSIDTNTKYHKYLHLNYPNELDAVEALKRGYINKVEFDAIALAAQKNDCPPKETSLGSNIGIHGIGTYNAIFKNLPFVFNWTNGSIAVSDENIDELSSVVKIGTPVKITY
jgi:murein L,D-transpeptidase YafK